VARRLHYHFSGIVQGVGFRPFIYRTAVSHELGGFVYNSPGGVVVEVEGPDAALDSFLTDVIRHPPPLADIAGYSSREVDPRGDREFLIIPSNTEGERTVHITPDTATCDECLRELFDPGNRRYRYPFINCTNCGPRLTIINGTPYDRVNTSMNCFPLCPHCREEYENPLDRRFHAEPNACPRCGPSLRLLDGEGVVIPSEDPVQAAIDRLREGHILAIKGLGGYHLAVDGTNEAAVAELRTRKFREEKPLAVMVKDLGTAERIAHIDEEGKDLLRSPQRPIVLLKKKPATSLAPSLAPGLQTLGIMLPYTPLHHLLLEKDFPALVMTSANQTDEPICIGNREAVDRLKGIADFFLVHDRDILIRCDDSVAMTINGAGQMMRRARGYAPKPIALNESYPSVLAVGPQMKATVCIVKDNHAFMSPHIGDMATPEARDFHHETVDIMKKIAECSPTVVACDLHPDYYTTRVARKMEGVEVIPIQHHHAHIVSCMAEHRLTGEVIGLAMDGTGYGMDGRIWGGEFLITDLVSSRRMGALATMLLPGAEKAIREPWRMAASLLKDAFGNRWIDAAVRLNLRTSVDEYRMIDRVMHYRFNTPETSSLGRLFDGVAALLGLRHQVSFEGQAAMELEGLVEIASCTTLPFHVENRGEMMILNLLPAVKTIAEERCAGRSSEELAAAFHATLAVSFAQVAGKIRDFSGINRIALSGGCFQNRILTEQCVTELTRAGFDVYTHRAVPTNDGGVSLGQAVSVAATIRQKQ
jgi:hydrogenase maturation protein HypF